MHSAAGPILAFTAVTLAGAGLYLVGGARATLAAGPEAVDPTPTSVALGSTTSLPTRTPLGPEPVGPSAAGLFLDDYFGADAPEVRAYLEGRGVDLDALSAPLPEQDLLALVPTWLVFAPSERAELLRTRLDWPEPLTSDWLSAHYGVLVELPPDHLATVDLLALQACPPIEAAVDRYLVELEAAMLVEYAEGRVRTSPFLAWPPTGPGTGSGGFYSLMRVGAGWVVSVGLEAGRHPTAIAARDELDGLVRMRDEEIREALLALQ